MNCSGCGFEVQSGFAFCPKCGARQPAAISALRILPFALDAARPSPVLRKAATIALNHRLTVRRLPKTRLRNRSRHDRRPRRIVDR
jgi:hypothetical protein